jgi:hypothetical protein
MIQEAASGRIFNEDPACNVDYAASRLVEKFMHMHLIGL